MTQRIYENPIKKNVIDSLKDIPFANAVELRSRHDNSFAADHGLQGYKRQDLGLKGDMFITRFIEVG